MTANSRSAIADKTTSSNAPFTATSVSISLTTKDLPTSLTWYRDVMGFTVVNEMIRDGVLRAAVIQGGAARIVLNQDDGGRGWERVKGEGFALSFITSESVDAIASRIKARGGTVDTEPADMPWGARIFRLRDPDGYRLSISSTWGD